MTIVRNVFRRKTRAFLTIFGITIGVLALVVMGAMAEKLNLLVDGGMRYYGDKVTVTDAGNAGTFGGPLSLAKVREIEGVDGVPSSQRAASAMLLDPKQQASMGVPPMIIGSDLQGRRLRDVQDDLHGGPRAPRERRPARSRSAATWPRSSRPTSATRSQCATRSSRSSASRTRRSPRPTRP